MLCKEAMEIITEYLLVKPKDKAPVKEALAHIANCDSCIHELDATITLLTGEKFDIAEKMEDFVSCSTCEELITRLAEMDEKEIKEKYSGAWNHIQSCKNCKERYTALKTMVQNERDGEYGQLPEAPTFGDVVKERDRTPLWKEFKEGTYILGQEVKILLHKHKTTFYELPSFLHSYALEPATVGPFRENEPKKIIQRLKLPDEKRKCEILVTFYSVSQNEADIELEITKLPENRGLTGAEVLLYDSQDRLLETSSTSEHGRVKFTKLRTDNYRVEIKCSDMVWELPLSLLESPTEKSPGE